MKPKQNDIEQAVAKIYCAMLDNVALQQHRLYLHDVYTYGTGAMRFDSIDGKVRHCAIHGCPHCQRRVDFERGKRQARARLLLVLAGLVVLVGLRFILR